MPRTTHSPITIIAPHNVALDHHIPLTPHMDTEKLPTAVFQPQHTNNTKLQIHGFMSTTVTANSQQFSPQKRWIKVLNRIQLIMPPGTSPQNTKNFWRLLMLTALEQQGGAHFSSLLCQLTAVQELLFQMLQ